MRYRNERSEIVERDRRAVGGDRWVVSHSWDIWKTEVVWMSLYFSVAVWLSVSVWISVAVWISIALIHAPVPTVRQAALRQNRLG